jgi:selenoprotein W-related protein
LLERFERDIAELTISPSGGGRFEVTVDGLLVFSKAALGRHAEIDEVLRAVEQREPVT